jgi:glycerol-3-phosphate dehydrogenase
MTECWDLVVIGGGIHGVGVAQAAAAAGHRVLVLEKKALASGTSSRSSKLIHGGLRYLETYELSLVYECLRERELLLKLAPGLVELKRFHIPVYQHTRRRPWIIRVGLGLYSVLGGLSSNVRFGTVPTSDWGDLDGLVTDDLEEVFFYFDAQTDDVLLTRAVMRSAADLGAELAVPARFVTAELRKDSCVVGYEANGRQVECQARVLINAGGPWVNEILQQVSPAQDLLPIELVQGAHVLVEGRLEQGLYYVESPRDGRAVFVMPHAEGTLVGTTEVRFRGDPSEVRALRTEIRYLARVLRHYFPRYLEGGWSEIRAAWAGLRVLPTGAGHAFHRSRETILYVDGANESIAPRLLSIYGGKLTSYRATAEKVMARVAPSLPERRPIADTQTLPLSVP